MNVSKKRKLVLAGASVFVVVMMAALAISMLRHEPAFYHRVEIAPGKARQEMSTECLSRFLDLKNYWQEGQREWDIIITESQLNSYFEEGFISHGLSELLRPLGIADPRVAVEHDKLRLAFRYGTAPWSAIISYDLRLWLAKDEANVICVEFLGRHAGALPIASQSLLNEISEAAGRNGFDMTWYRHEGNPVALVRVQPADRTQTPAQLRRLEVRQGWISIGGVSQEPTFTDSSRRLQPVGN
jgi:hypothetical protein